MDRRNFTSAESTAQRASDDSWPADFKTDLPENVASRLLRECVVAARRERDPAYVTTAASFSMAAPEFWPENMALEVAGAAAAGPVSKQLRYAERFYPNFTRFSRQAGTPLFFPTRHAAGAYIVGRLAPERLAPVLWANSLRAVPPHFLAGVRAFNAQQPAVGATELAEMSQLFGHFFRPGAGQAAPPHVAAFAAAVGRDLRDGRPGLPVYYYAAAFRGADGQQAARAAFVDGRKAERVAGAMRAAAAQQRSLPAADVDWFGRVFFAKE